MFSSRFSTQKLVHSALFVSLGIILPIAFHAVPNAGSVMLPMHIPVLLCGLVVGFSYGLVCGVLTPILSCLLSGMPPAAILPSMVCELAVYGTVTALLARFVPVKNVYAKTYIALGGAMLAGRVTFGVLNALIFRAGQYSMKIWLTASFVTAWPGILIQLVLIPAIIIALLKAKLIEEKRTRVTEPQPTQADQ